ncbi:MAG: hypothetical protein AAFZ38_05680 [Myxococcota bacterium]
MEWEPNPVQLIICDHCGTPGCVGSNFVTIVRLGMHLVWTAPDHREHDAWERDEYSSAEFVQRFGALLVHADLWTAWDRKFGALPAFESFPAATRHDLARTWLAESRGRVAPDQISDAPRLLAETLIASESHAAEPALERVQAVVNWVEAEPDGEAALTLRPMGSDEARLERFYFDGPSDEDWTPFLNAREPTLVLGSWAVTLER